MLESLHIANYALIDLIDIDFHPGLNIITGETGAGKSIMLGALSLILGGRADTRAVRHADRKSVIEATFAVGVGHPRLKAFCDENDIDWDDNHCILRREISPSGRSRAFVNDSPVPLAKLAEVAARLVDIHSQHQNQLLSQPAFQMEVIDTIAGNQDLLAEHRRRFEAFKVAAKALKGAKLKVERAREEEEYTRFQYEQLEELRLSDPAEQEELEARRDLLNNLTQVKEALRAAGDALSSGMSPALDRIDEALAVSSIFESAVSPHDDIAERLEAARIEIKDIADTLAAVDSNLEADPSELEDIDERLSSIYALQRRHHVDSLAGLIAIRDAFARKLRDLDNSDSSLASLEKEARKALALARESAAEVSKSRREAAEAFASRLIELARPLGMANLRCEVEVKPSSSLSATGADEVAFLFAFNKNQTLMPVGGAASGGEISRLMLSIKSIIADKMELPSIIFDEVDTGVSGDVANRMGLMMASIARSIQVIAITHLPQVAAKGSHHFKVYKRDDDTATHTMINELAADERVGEIALMLSGDPTSPSARQAAEALLDLSPKK
ncbi:MAG: DNA repair protein RecN [Pseudoflavonifractor sp.]|nr:DNA repair protein RecN [Alloprevotella sp.]MCM1117159.1 DNA repair protein RecN [Pseudoflavonifractor sp.]